MQTAQTNMSPAPKKLWKDYLLVIIGWPAVSTLVLLTFVMIRGITGQHVIYTSSYDLSFIRYAFWVTLGHLMAFIAPAYVFRKSLRNFGQFIVIIIMLLGISGQFFLRNASVGLGRIDVILIAGTPSYPNN